MDDTATPTPAEGVMPATTPGGGVTYPVVVTDVDAALRGGLEELAITIEHVDWLRDLMSGRYPEDVAMELIEHLQEEEHQHEIALRALTDTLKTRGVVDVDLGQALDAEVFRLHLMQDHFETARALNSKEMSADLAAKVREHISEEEERHLLALRSLKSRLAAVNPANVSVDVYDPTVKVEQRIPHQPRPKVGDSALESAWKGTGAAPTSAPEEAPQATVGDLPETPPQTLPAEPSRLDRALGSLMGEPQSTGRIRLPLPPATWQPGATVGSLKDPRL